MGMNVGKEGGDSEPMVEMNTTPLIDVMLVLIIMLIITIPIQTHAVKLDMPQPNIQPQDPVPPVVIDLRIDFDGTISWNNSPVNGEQLVSYMHQAAKQDPQPELHLRPNKLAKYDVVAKVLATAQRTGVTNIGIIGNEEYRQ
jgi:biopolymer transport protein ExbD